jgi:hypothetical protein
MKKVLVILAGIMAATLLAGCGEDKKETKKASGVEEISIEEIKVEDIQVENILVEEIQTERIYIDGEYEAELEYNSKVNTWDNIPIQTF